MMTKTFLGMAAGMALSLLSVNDLCARRLVDVTYEKQGKNFVFKAVSEADCPYTVRVKFTHLEGTTDAVVGGESAYLVRPREHKTLFTLRPASDEDAVGFSWSTSSIAADYVSEADSSFVYLSPLAEGKKVIVNRTVSLSDWVAGKKVKGKTAGLGFKTESGDTIYAMRAGLVYEAHDDKKPHPDRLTSYDENENSVCIYHKDGSVARYKGFRQGGLFVSVGDKVRAGQPIGIIGGEGIANGARLLVGIHGAFPSDGENAFCGKERKSFVPVLATTERETCKPSGRVMFQSVHSKEIIMKEMSKKEKKAYLKK